jgi:hypothetical protein
MQNLIFFLYLHVSRLLKIYKTRGTVSKSKQHNTPTPYIFSLTQNTK